MGRIRTFSIFLALCLVLALLPVASAHAAEGGSIWLRHLPTEEGYTIALVADTAIGSGVITITYETDVYTFQELTVDSAFVAAYAVNEQEAGTIKISWVGTGADIGAHVPMRLQFSMNLFSGAYPSVDLSGSIYSANGEEVAITGLDFGAFNAVAYQADSLKAEDYTADSFAAVQAALAAANAQVNVETVSQAQVDAATQALKAAMDALVVYVPEPEPTDPPATEPQPTQPQPTEPRPTEPTQPGSTPAKPDPTQPSTQAPAPAPKGDNGWMLMVLAVLGVAAVVAAVVILKKRGRK